MQNKKKVKGIKKKDKKQKNKGGQGNKFSKNGIYDLR